MAAVLTAASGRAAVLTAGGTSRNNPPVSRLHGDRVGAVGTVIRMRSWTAPQVPTLPGRGIVPLLHDSASGARVAVTGPRARLYVCGVTPYDATHLGHAATYVTFDVLLRAWRDAGLQIGYVQNVTDVDDPLLVRATRDGRRWQDLAAEQIELFRTDMAALRVIPPDSLVGAVEAIPAIVRRIQDLVVAGSAYSLDSDVYYSVDADQDFGYVSHLTDADMVAVFAANGGDPERVGKKNPLDPLLWRGERPGEPAWESPLGRGRPGWHIECATIALDALGSTIDVQGGGRDLVFPHHEMSAANAETLTGVHPFAACYTHVGMVRLGGDKMSKSRGNLEFVHRLLDVGTDPSAIRLALLAEPYGSDRDWNDQVLAGATDRLTTWRHAVRAASGPAATPVRAAVRAAIADDLDTPQALRTVDAWAAAAGRGAGNGSGPGDAGPDEAAAPGEVRDLVDALLGVTLGEAGP